MVSHIVSRLLEQRVLHIRGTPASGKTTLLDLIHHYLAMNHSGIAVRSIQWRTLLNGKSSHEAILNFMGETDLTLLGESASEKCILIDEAQDCYNDSFLWNRIKAIDDASENVGLIIVLATAYGSATVMPADLPDGTAPTLDPSQRLSIRPIERETVSLCLDQEEMEDVIRRGMRLANWEIPFADDMIAWLHELTSGHTGALSAILRKIFEDHVSILYLPEFD